MYCHPEFKKMIDIRRIEYGSKDSINFTKKIADNPDLIKGIYKNENKKKQFKQPSIF